MNVTGFFIESEARALRHEASLQPANSTGVICRCVLTVGARVLGAMSRLATVVEDLKEQMRQEQPRA